MPDMPPSRPFRVIVVDDDEDIRGLIVGQLAQDHYVVEAAGSLAELRGLMAAGAVDLIVLDLNLPDGDGLSLCRELRGQGNGVQIIMVTARTAEIDAVAPEGHHDVEVVPRVLRWMVEVGDRDHGRGHESSSSLVG